jgi:hypothetical protein
VKSKCRHWVDDAGWLQSTWPEVDDEESVVSTEVVEFLATETGIDKLNPSDSATRHNQLANEALVRLRLSCLRTRFTSPSGRASITLDEVVGYVAGSHMLNDSILYYALEHMADVHGACMALSSHVTVVGWPEPTTPIAKTKFVILPGHLKTSVHWGVIIVRLELPIAGCEPGERDEVADDEPDLRDEAGVNQSSRQVSTEKGGSATTGVNAGDVNSTYRSDAAAERPAARKVTAYYYEGISASHYRRYLKDIWRNQFLPFLESWHARCGDGEPFPEVQEVSIDTPKQPDSYSCGVVALAMVYSFVSGKREFQNDVVTRKYVNIMRLRSLWLILCPSTISEVDVKNATTARETYRKLVVYYNKSKSV